MRAGNIDFVYREFITATMGKVSSEDYRSFIEGQELSRKDSEGSSCFKDISLELLATSHGKSEKCADIFFRVICLKIRTVYIFDTTE